MRWPKHVKAQPTLKGLRVQPENWDLLPAGTLYPWGQVGRVHAHSGVSTWVAYDKDGKEVTLDGRKLYLSIPGARASRAATRAQERHLRNAWRERRLSISETYEPASFIPAVIMLVSGVLATGGWVWMVLPSLIRRLEEARSLSMPASYPALLAGCAIALPFMVLGMWLPFLWIFLQQRKINVASARCQSRLTRPGTRSSASG